MGDIWDQEDAWVRAPQVLRQFDSRHLDLTLVHSEEYIDYLRLTLPPAHAPDAAVSRAREKLAATPIVEVILAHQQPDGSWPLGGPPWFRVYPRPLMVLLEYGMYEHASVQRGLHYLLSTISGGRFVWPRHEAHDPKEYYVAHQGRSLQVMNKAGVVDHPLVRSVAEGLMTRQRWDGGWSVKQAWMYRLGETQAEPRPSCWICTLEATRGLSAFLTRPSEIVDRLLMFWRANLNEKDVGAILSLADFCATVGMRAGDGEVEWLRSLLRQARGPDGRFPTLPDYFEVLNRHVQWRLGADSDN